MRLWLTVLGLVALVVIAASSIWWLFIASFGDRQIEDFIARAAKDGTAITVAEQERSGFPFDVRWQLRGITVSRQSPDGNLTGEIPELLVEAVAWRPQHLAFSADKPQSWQWQAAGANAGRNYTAQSINGLVEPQDGKSGWRMTAALQAVNWRVDGAEPADGAASEVFAEILLPLDRRSADFDIKLNQVKLSGPLVFGRYVESVSARGNINPIPKDLTPTGLTEWQQAGGTLSVKQSAIMFGALQAGANGDVALDQAMRPAGKMQLHVNNPEAILTIATREGWIKPDQLGYAQIGVGLFSRRNASGVNELNTNMEMRGGGLWVGPIRLANLMPLVKAR